MINGETSLYGLIGHPVRHSLSPLIQNAAFQAAGLNAVYVAFDVTSLPKAVEGLRGLNLEGVNVTRPWKYAILPYLDAIREPAQCAGAVNTVVRKDRRLIGTNTDVTGLLRLLRERGIRWEGRPVVVLGAGGAARAVVTVLKTIGARPVVFNRERDKQLAAQLGKDLECPTYFLEEIFLPEDTAAVINCTPVGMNPLENDLPFPVSLLRKELVVMDAVYAPIHTKLLREAEKLGCATIRGTEWLLAQGADSFTFWTGQTAPEEIMKKTLLTWIASHET